MAEITWVKIATATFEDEKIRLIEKKYPREKDVILIVWFKLLLLAGKKNDGGDISIYENKPISISDLSLIFERDEAEVEFALNIFSDSGMIDISDDVISIVNWSKHQSVDKMDKMKKKNAERQKKFREKNKSTLQCNRHEEKEKDLDIELDIKQEQEIKESEVEDTKDNIDYKSIVDYLNEKAGTSYRSSSKGTQKWIKARIEEGFELNDFKKVIDNKVLDWKDNDMEKYLRPETLFSNKFEGYLNEKQVKQKQEERPAWFTTMTAEDEERVANNPEYQI